jgi:hypothetical protein
MLRVSQRWLFAPMRLTARALVPIAIASAAAHSPAAGSASRPAPSATALSVGTDVSLRGGRELSLQLTPTPTRCAPLLSLRY